MPLWNVRKPTTKTDQVGRLVVNRDIIAVNRYMSCKLLTTRIHFAGTRNKSTIHEKKQQTAVVEVDSRQAAKTLTLNK